VDWEFTDEDGETIGWGGVPKEELAEIKKVYTEECK
jgi:hypothetical protein